MLSCSIRLDVIFASGCQIPPATEAKITVERCVSLLAVIHTYYSYLQVGQRAFSVDVNANGMASQTRPCFSLTFPHKQVHEANIIVLFVTLRAKIFQMEFCPFLEISVRLSVNYHNIVSSGAFLQRATNQRLCFLLPTLVASAISMFSIEDELGVFHCFAYRSSEA